MKKGELYGNRKAALLAQELKHQLMGQCKRIDIAGSIRRGKPVVHDIELVILPQDANNLLARLDQLVLNRTLALRLDEKYKRIAWGRKFRAAVYKGVPVDIFIATPDNYGLTLWLRTGPGDSNRLVMDKLKRERSPIRVGDGNVWWVDYPPIYTARDDNITRTHLLRTPDERTVFYLLGIDAVTPEWRTPADYKHQFKTAKQPTLDDLIRRNIAVPVAALAENVRQPKLF